MEVLRRHSNNYGAVQRVSRLTRHLATHSLTRAPGITRPSHRSVRLDRRLSAADVSAVLSAYEAGETTREIGARYGLAHSSVNKLLKQHGVTARRRSPGDAERAQAVALYAAGKTSRQIGAEMGLGASTVQRVLRREGVDLRPRFGRHP